MKMNFFPVCFTVRKSERHHNHEHLQMNLMSCMGAVGGWRLLGRGTCDVTE